MKARRGYQWVRQELERLAEPHGLPHMAIGPEDEIEEKLGFKVHVRTDPAETMAWCFTCRRCVECSTHADYVWAAAREHAMGKAWEAFIELAEHS
ncbi:MAG: hypothetical protein ACYCV4_18865 [Dermatophilaceae bacterium]